MTVRFVAPGVATLTGAEPDMDMVAQVSTGQEAIEQVRLHQPDVTLMDLQVFGRAFVSHNGIVSFLEPPTDHERAEKVIIPRADAAQPIPDQLPPVYAALPKGHD